MLRCLEIVTGLAVLGVLVCCSGTVSQSAPAPIAQEGEAPGGVSYARDVQPIFDKFCISCHGTTKGLSLEMHASVLAGATDGPVVIAGEPDRSELILHVEGTKPPQMPPMGSLSQERREILRLWIAEGAPNN